MTKMNVVQSDFLIIGAGIVGLTFAKNLKERFKNRKIVIVEKEKDVAYHASGRNSGVLHAGFYYAKDSLKAKFSKDGNEILKEYCKKNNLKLNECGKVVVTSNDSELETLYELKKRGDANGVELVLVNEHELTNYEANAKTCEYALWSGNTATVDPKEICHSIKHDIISDGIGIFFNAPYKSKINNNTIICGNTIFETEKVVNAAGLYADKIAKEFNFSKDYVIIPFKGIYLEYAGNDRPIKRNIYPVPNLKNPFLGVHYTINVGGTIEIGPTAIPAFWRENYKGFDEFKLNEMIEILLWEAKLFITDGFGFRSLAFEEIKKYNKSYLISLAAKMVKNINSSYFNKWGKAGIRAQLLNIKTKELVQDFVVEGDKSSIHILNAVSPAFTCSIPFTNWIIDNYIV